MPLKVYFYSIVKLMKTNSCLVLIVVYINKNRNRGMTRMLFMGSACLTTAGIFTFIQYFHQINCSIQILQGVATGRSHCYLTWTQTILEESLHTSISWFSQVAAILPRKNSRIHQRNWWLNLCWHILIFSISHWGHWTVHTVFWWKFRGQINQGDD